MKRTSESAHNKRKGSGNSSRLTAVTKITEIRLLPHQNTRKGILCSGEPTKQAHNNHTHALLLLEQSVQIRSLLQNVTESEIPTDVNTYSVNRPITLVSRVSWLRMKFNPGFRMVLSRVKIGVAHLRNQNNHSKTESGIVQRVYLITEQTMVKNKFGDG